MSLFRLPPGFPPQLAFLWPLIWVQVLMLRAQIRAAYGRGVVYRWSVTDNLRVYLVRIEWMPGQKTDPEWLTPSAHFSDRLAAACDGRAFAPDYIRTLSLSLGLVRKSGRIAPARAKVGVRGLPLPET
jgi:hypothetical protein